jgi:hypothetical protein
MKKAVVRSAVGKAHKRVMRFVFRDRYGDAIEIGFSHALYPDLLGDAAAPQFSNS